MTPKRKAENIADAVDLEDGWCNKNLEPFWTLVLALKYFPPISSALRPDRRSLLHWRRCGQTGHS